MSGEGTIHLPYKLDCVFSPSIAHAVTKKQPVWTVEFRKITLKHGDLMDLKTTGYSLVHRLIFRGLKNDIISRLAPVSGSPPDGCTSFNSSFPIETVTAGEQTYQTWCPSRTGGINADEFYVFFQDGDTEKERDFYVEVYQVMLTSYPKSESYIDVITSEGLSFDMDDSLGIPDDQFKWKQPAASS